MNIATSNVMAKIAAVVAGLGLVMMSFAFVAPAKADTTSDLQAQIQSLLAQIASLQAQLGTSQGSGSAACAFTKDLTVGSKGADVTCLQNALNAKGYLSVAATGFFGPLTQAAVAKWQAASGVTPAAGYFGAKSRAAFAAMGGGTTGTTTGTTGSTGLSGGDGQFKNISTLGDIESSVNENSNDVKVLGVSMDAKNSDLAIQRVDVTFDLTNSTGSSALTKYLSSASLWLDGKKLGTMDASSASKDGKVYTMRFSGMNGIVKEGKTGDLYVSIDSVTSVDSSEDGKSVIVSIPADGVRAVNGAGVSDTYVSSSDSVTETFSVTAASTGTLTLTEASANPNNELVKADSNNTTDNVTLMVVNLKAKNQDIDITSLPVGFKVTGTSNVNDIIQSVRLMKGSTTLKSKTVSGTGAYAQVTFDNIDTTVSQDNTDTYTVVADIKKFSGTNDSTHFSAGDTLFATTTGSNSAYDVEDSNGNSVTPSGSVTGGTVTFAASGLTVDFVSSNATVRTGTIAGDADIVDGTIKFKVTAGDDDIWIEGDMSQGTTTPYASTDGLAWATTTDSTTGTSSSYSATLSADGDSSNDVTTAGSQAFKIPAGTSRTLTFQTSIPTGTDNGAVGVRITGIKWDTANGGDVLSNLYNFSLDSFKTVTQTGLNIH